MNAWAVGVLAGGLALAAAIFAFADEPPPVAASYVIVEGESHAIPARLTRQYVSQLERFGGKAAVLFDELLEWFASLAHGRRLAWTIAVLSTLAALVLHLYALHFLPGEKPPPR